MSSTNRGPTERSLDDVYVTPAWCVEALLNRTKLLGGLWMEPAAGDGAIIKAVNAIRRDVNWIAVEKRSECSEKLQALNIEYEIRDFLKPATRQDHDRPGVIITNPPFSFALEFVEQAFHETDGPVVMLARLNFLGTAKRAPFFHKHCPDVYVLPQRPSFTPDGRTDSIEYCWCLWHSRKERHQGVVKVLDACKPGRAL